MINMKINCVLSIAGSDSCSGAGIQADIKTVASCGAYCATAITAVTAQNTMGVTAIEVLSPEIVKAQIDAVISDMNITAIKLGMIPSKEIVDIVAEAIIKNKIKNIVLDPVMVATSGDMLVSQETAEYIIEKLLPLCSVITPNIPEAEFISGLKITSEDEFENVSQFFKKTNCKALLLKAGHLESEYLTDYLYDFGAKRIDKYSYKKTNTPNTHGTGCTLSSSIATYLCRGKDIHKAVELAEKYIHEAIEASNYILGDGHGSINHFYQLEIEE